MARSATSRSGSEKVLNRLRALHGGEALRLGASGTASAGEGVFADQIGHALRRLRAAAPGSPRAGPELSTAAFRRPGAQPGLFD